MSETVRERLERLAVRLAAARTRAEKSSESVEGNVRRAYQLGCLQAVCEDTAEELRKILKSDLASKRDALDPKAVRTGDAYEIVSCQCPSRKLPVSGVCPGCYGARVDNDMALKP